MTRTSLANRQDTVRAIYGIAEDLLQQGYTKIEIEKILVEKGLKPNIAGALVEKVARSKAQARQRRAKLPKLVFGLLALVIGLINLSQLFSSSENLAWLGGTIACFFFGYLWVRDWYKSKDRVK